MQHTLLVLVEDTPGALNRVASLLRRRGFRLESLTFARTGEPRVAKITVVITSDADGVNRLAAYLGRLIDVLDVEARAQEG